MDAGAGGDMPEPGYEGDGEAPLQPDLRHVLVIEEVNDDIHHTPAAPLGRHA